MVVAVDHMLAALVDHKEAAGHKEVVDVDRMVVVPVVVRREADHAAPEEAVVRMEVDHAAQGGVVVHREVAVHKVAAVHSLGWEEELRIVLEEVAGHKVAVLAVRREVVVHTVAAGHRGVAAGHFHKEAALGRKEVVGSS